MKKKRTVAKTILASLRSFTRKLERGIPIEATRITRVQTPDGPMHVRSHEVLNTRRSQKP